ncbi:MAG: MFS transporter [Methylococcaceae bacterium]|nr:MFS transporter [Methylococcaceae bacterium]MDZ4156422.1 MFS transporter [Methylococcales bacterium]MDP2391638.1 MFS transporter [Methylococcaceae bacterium]MDP3018137.1 MFS transporter [Methylococcaceae bacterium]MDP3389350.1 MFS transporter [Methylococcaceae bacterium]
MAVPYWRLSGFYFFYFATVGGFIPYWSLYLKENGFNPAEIGELSALLGGTRIFAPILWGWMADRTGKSLRIIRGACFFAAAIFAGFLFAHGYFLFAVISVAFSFFWNAALPQFEAVTLLHLQQEAHAYSRIRLWGSIGFIAAVLGIGRLLDIHALALLPWIITGLLTGIWLVSLVTPDISTARQNIASIGIMRIVKQPEVLAFLAVNMLLQLAHAPYYVFYSIYLQHHGYSTTLTGSLWALAVVAEIVLFIYMGWVFKRFTLRSVLLFSIVLAVARWLIIGWGADYLGLLIVAQLLHAATFAGVHAVAMQLVYQYFGRHHQGKGQALYSSLSFGLGGMLGSFYSGYYWELLGPQLVYSMAAGCCALALLIVYIWIGRENGQNKLLLG